MPHDYGEEPQNLAVRESHVRVSRVIGGAPSAERYLIAIWDSGPGLDPIRGMTDMRAALYPLSVSCLLPRGQSSRTAATQEAGATSCGPAELLSRNV